MEKKSIAFIAALVITMVGSVGAVMGGVFATNIGRADASSTGYVEFPTTIANGYSASYALVNGCIYSWGTNGKGQLGIGNESITNSSVPLRVDEEKSNYITISSRGDTGSIAAIDSDGYLYMWGENSYGMLGLGHTNVIYAPTLVVGKKWKTISSGNHTLAIDDKGHLYAWGLNSVGQLGLGDSFAEQTYTTPQLVDDTRTWRAVAVGGFHSLALDTQGNLYAWGRNESYELGLGETDTRNRNAPTLVGESKNWKQISASSSSYAIDGSDTLYVWGLNDFGQLGLGHYDDKGEPTQVGAAGNWKTINSTGKYACAINKTGKIYSWGENQNGRLGIGNTDHKNVPTPVMAEKNWRMVSTAYRHAMAVDTAGLLYAWGDNVQGQLGDGTKVQKTSPILVQPYFHPDPITPYPVVEDPAPIDPEPYNPRLDETKDALYFQMSLLKSIMNGENTDLTITYTSTATALLQEMEIEYYNEQAEIDVISELISQAKCLIMVNPAKFMGLVELITKVVDEQSVIFTPESWSKYQSKLSQINALLEELESRLQTIDSQEQTIFDQQQLLDEIETLYEELNELYLAQQGLEPAGDPNESFDPLFVGLIIACGFLLLGIPLTYVLGRKKAVTVSDKPKKLSKK